MPRPAIPNRPATRWNTALASLRRTHPHLAHAFANLDLWASRGYGTGAGNSSGSGTSRPTEAIALTDDQAAHDAHEKRIKLVGLIDLAATTITEIERLVTSLTITNTTLGADGCRLCAVIHHDYSWQQIYANGRCSWHYDFHKRYGIDAHSEITRWHLNHLGSNVPPQLVREHHPEQYEQHHTRRRARHAP